MPGNGPATCIKIIQILTVFMLAVQILPFSSSNGGSGDYYPVDPDVEVRTGTHGIVVNHGDDPITEVVEADRDNVFVMESIVYSLPLGSDTVSVFAPLGATGVRFDNTEHDGTSGVFSADRNPEDPPEVVARDVEDGSIIDWTAPGSVRRGRNEYVNYTTPLEYKNADYDEKLVGISDDGIFLKSNKSATYRSHLISTEGTISEITGQWDGAVKRVRCSHDDGVTWAWLQRNTTLSFSSTGYKFVFEANVSGTNSEVIQLSNMSFKIVIVWDEYALHMRLSYNIYDPDRTFTYRSHMLYDETPVVIVYTWEEYTVTSDQINFIGNRSERFPGKYYFGSPAPITSRMFEILIYEKGDTPDPSTVVVPMAIVALLYIVLVGGRYSKLFPRTGVKRDVRKFKEEE